MIGWASCCDCRYSAAHPELQGRDGARAVVRKWTWQAALLSGKIAWVFFPLSSSSFIFFSPTCKISFRSNGNHLEQTPYSHVWGWTSCIFVFAKSPYFQSVPLGCAPLPLTLPRGVFFSLSTERNVPKASEVVHANQLLCLQGFSLKKQCNVRLSEVLTRAKNSASGCLTLEVPEASISDLFGILLFCPSSGLWKLLTVLAKPEGLYNRLSFYRLSLHRYFTDWFGPILAAERKTVIMHAWEEAGISDASFQYWAVSCSYLWESTADVHYRAVEWQVERGIKASWSGRTPQVFERWRAGDCNWDTEIWNMSGSVCGCDSDSVSQYCLWLLTFDHHGTEKGHWGLTDQ